VPIRQRFDRLLLGATVLQTAIGLAILASASWLIATERYGRPGSYFVTWQAATAMIGLGVLVVCMHLRSSLLTDRRLVAGALAASWVLLLATFAQAPVAATHRWINIGGISLQPSVLARLALIMLLAILLDEARREGWPWKRLAVVAGVCVATTAVVVFEPDLGSAALMLVVVGAMAFVSGMPLKLLAAPAVFSAVALVAAILGSPYRLARVRAFFDSGADSAHRQRRPARPRLRFRHAEALLPAGAAHRLHLRHHRRGARPCGPAHPPGSVLDHSLARFRDRRPSRGALLAFGITIAFAIQTLIHMIVCLDLLPPKGIPLPLVSYGKTEMVVTLVSVGILLNLSREAKA